jgi:carbon storage regulator
MLVISRKPGEKIKIGEAVYLSVLSVNGDKVTIGIDAPKEVNILRGELMETIEYNKESSAQTLAGDTIRDLAALIRNKKTEE